MPKAIARTSGSLVGLLQDLVRIESTTGHEGELAVFIHDHLVRLGLEPELVPLGEGRVSVGVRVPGSQSGTVVFCGHLDTVDVRNQGWTHPPFEGVLEGTRMFGRGTADMKGGLVAMLGTAAWLKENRVRPEKSVVFAFTADEESATYGGAMSLIEAGFLDDAELLVIPEPTEGRVCVGQKGQLWVDVCFDGRAAHGALPEQGANAALAASDLVVTLTHESARFVEKPGLGRSTASANEIHGGWQVNVIPDTARVSLDFRVVDKDDHDAAMSLVAAVCREVGARWGVKADHHVRQDKAPLVSDPTAPAVRAFLEAARATGRSVEHLQIVPYSTDGAAIVPHVGVPLVVCGPGSIFQAHQPDEYLEVGQMFDVLELFTKYVSGTMT